MDGSFQPRGGVAENSCRYGGGPGDRAATAGSRPARSPSKNRGRGGDIPVNYGVPPTAEAVSPVKPGAIAALVGIE